MMVVKGQAASKCWLSPRVLSSSRCCCSPISTPGPPRSHSDHSLAVPRRRSTSQTPRRRKSRESRGQQSVRKVRRSLAHPRRPLYEREHYHDRFKWKWDGHSLIDVMTRAKERHVTRCGRNKALRVTPSHRSYPSSPSVYFWYDQTPRSTVAQERGRFWSAC